MKNTIIILLCLACLPFLSLNAQIVNVCLEEDSVTLAVENYQYGNIQWQQSTDNENWEDIEGAIFHTYKCFPENSTYFRAWITYQNCPPDSSQVSFLQRKIQANAGVDKVIHTGFTTELFGNEYDGTFGQWTVLLGDSAQIDNTYAGNTYFYGTDSLYRLCWSLTDACGTTSDTITIKYVTNIYNDRIVIVDTTDLILSDSTELSEGIYRILFSNPAPTVSYSSILVGIPNGGFLRKVQSCIYIGDTCCMNTVQASPADLLIHGTIHIDDFASMIYTRGSNMANTVVLDHCPTRAEIMSDSMFHSNKMIFYPMANTVECIPQFTPSKSVGWHITFPHLASPLNLAAGGEARITDILFDCKPHIGFELACLWNGPLSLAFGSYNGTLDVTMKIRIDVPTLNYNVQKKLWKASKKYLIMMGWLPVVYSLNFDLKVESSASVAFTTPFDAELTHHTDYDAILGIEDWTPRKKFSFKGGLSGKITKDQSITGAGNVTVEAFLGGEIYLSLYEALSVYFTIGPKGDWSMCDILDNGRWGSKQGTSVCGVAKMGLRSGDLFQNFGLDIGDYNFAFEFLKKDMRGPCKIECISGNNQLFNGSNQPLPQPIRIKSYDCFNRPSSNDRIRFEPEYGGFVNSPNNYFVTDENGIAEAIWCPESPDSKLKVSAYDCDAKYIQGAPITISTTGDGCTASTLTSQTYLDNGLVNLIVSGGVPPYQYSIDGVTYENQYTPFSPELGTEYTIHVKDAQNCETQSIYTRPSPVNEIICLENNVSIPLTVCNIVDIFGHYTDNDDFYARWLDFEGPNGYLTLYLGDLYNPSLLFNQGVYSGIYCTSGCDGNFIPLSSNHFYLDISYLHIVNNTFDLVAGEISYTRINNINVFSFTFTLENGQHYAGNFTGALGHEVYNNMKSDTGNRMLNKQGKRCH